MNVVGAPLPGLTVVLAVAATLVVLLDHSVGWLRQAEELPANGISEHHAS